MADPEGDHGLLATLRGVPLFERLDEATRREIAAAMRPFHVAAGELVVRQGDPGDAFFVIQSGQVRVFAGGAQTGVQLARLGPGRYFGEMALVTGEPRGASVVAEEPCDFLMLDVKDFQRLIDHYPAFRTSVQRVAEARAAGGHVFENEPYLLLGIESAAGSASIGASAANDLVLSAHGVAPHHAELRWDAGAIWIRDLGAAAGVYLNGVAVSEAEMAEGDVLWLGAARLFLHDGALRLFQPSRGVRLDARGLARTVGQKTLLEDVDLTFYPGEMVGIVGPSGAGKTTLMHLLLGLNAPSAGSVLYDGQPLSTNTARNLLGYVPQQDIVHPELTPRECLQLAAKLRASSAADERTFRGRIESVLREVRLEAQAETRVARLSGGQRKRACVAVELLSEPRILFLDEPTSGLDPALDDQMMHLFRALADAGRTVVLTTHATRNLRLCDRVVVVANGRLAFTGTPSEALDYFGVEDFSEMYAPLLQSTGAELSERFDASPLHRRVIESRMEGGAPTAAEAVTAPAEGGSRFATTARQFAALVRRDFLVMLRDRPNLALRLLGPPLMAAALLLTFESTIFNEGTLQGGNVREAITLLYLSAAICLFLSAITWSNAITREDAIFRRERVVSLSPLAYTGSKLAWLAVVSLLQGGFVALVLAIGIDFPPPVAETVFMCFLVFALTAACGGVLGLFISALSPNADRAAILSVLAIIPQLIFGGSTVPRTEMEAPARLISDLMVSKWVLELLGQITNLDRRLLLQSVYTADLGEFVGKYDVRIETPFDTAFEIEPTWRWLVLFGWCALFAIGLWFVQSRKARPR